MKIVVSDLYFTNDGGKKWDSKFSMPGFLKTVFFINETIGFGVGSLNFNNPDFTTFIKTIDGGNNWVELSEITDFVAEDMSFLNDQIGWVVGKVDIDLSQDLSSARVLSTKDGGEKWDLAWKSEVEGPSYGLNSIHIANSVVWAVGESGLIVRSILPYPFQVIAPVTDLPLNDVWFSDEDHGWIAGGYYGRDFQSILLKTIDGGQSWSETRFDKWLINDMHFSDSLHGWAVGTDTSRQGMILETFDGGDNWTAKAEGLSASLKAIHFKDGVGWAVGYNGLVLRTDDGSTWIDQNSGKVYPSKYTLSQNYPNPFNPTTMISYQLATNSEVELSVYNLLGQKVATLVSKKQSAGVYKEQWDATGFASGLYFYRLETDKGFVKTNKLVLLK